MNSAPFYHWGICVPKVDTDNLLNTMGAQTGFPLQYCPAKEMYLMKGPYGAEWHCTRRHGGGINNGQCIVREQSLNFILHGGLKFDLSGSQSI